MIKRESRHRKFWREAQAANKPIAVKRDPRLKRKYRKIKPQQQTNEKVITWWQRTGMVS